MKSLEVSAADARDVYCMALENCAKLEKALSKFPDRTQDPTALHMKRELERFRGLRDRANAIQQLEPVS